MRVAIYARVSTKDHDQNPERQILKCKQYCELHEHIISQIIEEKHTGDSPFLERPQVKGIDFNKVEGIIIFSIDRLTREHPTKVFRLLNHLKDRGIKVISITEPAFNMEGEFSEVIMFLMTWYNNYFLKKLRRDIKSGMDKARQEGKIIGRPKTKFNKFRAYELLFKAGLSQREVAKELNTSLATINRFKKSEENDPNNIIPNKTP